MSKTIALLILSGLSSLADEIHWERPPTYSFRHAQGDAGPVSLSYGKAMARFQGAPGTAHSTGLFIPLAFLHDETTGFFMITPLNVHSNPRWAADFADSTGEYFDKARVIALKTGLLHFSARQPFWLMVRRSTLRAASRPELEALLLREIQSAYANNVRASAILGEPEKPLLLLKDEERGIGDLPREFFEDRFSAHAGLGLFVKAVSPIGSGWKLILSNKLGEEAVVQIDNRDEAISGKMTKRVARSRIGPFPRPARSTTPD